MGVYDQAERFAIKRLDPPGLLRWLLTGLDEDLMFSRWLETQMAPFPGEPDRRCDCVAEFVSKSGTQPPWACLVEPQGQWQSWFLTRALQYLLQLHEELRHGPHGEDRYSMMVGIVDVCDRPLQKTLSWRPPKAPAEVGLTAGVWIRNVYSEKALATLEAIEAKELGTCLLVWVPLMQGGEDPEIIPRWRDLAARLNDRAMQANHGGLALIFAEKRGRADIWQKGLEGWNVEESLLVKQWQQSAFEKGIEKGMERGEHAGLRNALSRLVQVRLKAPLPADLQAAIAAETNTQRLEGWIEVAGVAGSIEELQTAILGGGTR